MSDPKTQKSSKPDSLTETSQGAGIALSESELDKVAGGTKAKVANKAADAVDGYIRG
jgi:hypothetical protein